MYKEIKKAFTLAETMVTLTILGVIAAIAIPTIAVKHRETTNRTKFKEAVQIYDTAIRSMVTEQRVNSNAKLLSQIPLDNCTNSSSFFIIKRVLSSDNGTHCRFMTGNGIYWDISNIQRVVVALNEKDLNTVTADSDTNRAFYLISDIDADGILRVNDIAYETGTDKTDLAKLYDYINRRTESSNTEVASSESIKDYCENNNTYLCITKVYQNPNFCPTFACKYQFGAYDDKPCPADLAVKDLRDCKRCKPAEKLCDVFDENGFHRLKIANCKADFTECKYIQERNDTDKTILQLDYTYSNGKVSGYTEKRLKDDGKTLIKQWTGCNIDTAVCTKLTDYYDDGKTIKRVSNYDVETGNLKNAEDYNSKGRNYYYVSYKEDGTTIDYYTERIYDETGTKTRYKNEYCSVENICKTRYIYTDDGANFSYKYVTNYRDNGSKIDMIENSDDGKYKIGRTFYDSNNEVTERRTYDYNSANMQTVTKYFTPEGGEKGFDEIVYNSDNTTVNYSKFGCITATDCKSVKIGGKTITCNKSGNCSAYGISCDKSSCGVKL